MSTPEQTQVVDSDDRPCNDVIARCTEILRLVDAYVDRPSRHTRGELRSRLHDELTVPARVEVLDVMRHVKAVAQAAASDPGPGPTLSKTPVREALRTVETALLVMQARIDLLENEPKALEVLREYVSAADASATQSQRFFEARHAALSLLDQAETQAISPYAPPARAPSKNFR